MEKLLGAWLHENGYITFYEWDVLENEELKTGTSIRKQLLANDSAKWEYILSNFPGSKIQDCNCKTI